MKVKVIEFLSMTLQHNSCPLPSPETVLFVFRICCRRGFCKQHPRICIKVFLFVFYSFTESRSVNKTQHGAGFVTKLLLKPPTVPVLTGPQSAEQTGSLLLLFNVNKLSCGFCHTIPLAHRRPHFYEI